MTTALEVVVQRGGAGARLDRFAVPRLPFQTVLDVVSWIQREADPTLAYRFACRVGMCGSCAVMANGLPRWACRTRVEVAAPRGQLVLAPLRNLPVIKDLVVDMAPFFSKWRRAGGTFAPKVGAADFAVVPPSSPDRRAADDAIECIGCGICYAACDVVRNRPNFLGPAALNRAWSLVNDVRDAARARRLHSLATEDGAFSCRSLGSCTHFCPKGLSPTAAIAGLKRAALRSGKGGGASP